MEDELLESIRKQLEAKGWTLPPNAKSFDGGGGGKVFRCYRTPVVQRVADAARQNRQNLAPTIIDLMLRGPGEPSPVGVLKVSKVPEERMRREIDLMKDTVSPHLVKAHAWDDGDPPRWFVMDLYERGMLHEHLRRYRGDSVRSVAALVPIASVLGALHKRKVIHRDVKTKNIFVDANERLVLGDLGIAHDESGERYTKSETPRSRDWMPRWPDEDLNTPKQDVYMTARVLYAMLAGDKAFEPNWFDDPRHDLESLFPQDARMAAVNHFLREHITLQAGDCVSENGTELAARMSALLDEISARPKEPRALFTWTAATGSNPQAGDNANFVYIPVCVPAGCRSLVARARGFKSGGAANILLELSHDTGGGVLAASPRVVAPPNNWSEPMVVAIDPRPRPEWFRLSLRATDGQTSFVAGLVVYAE